MTPDFGFLVLSCIDSHTYTLHMVPLLNFHTVPVNIGMNWNPKSVT
jgi:hypothetical protein